MSKVRRKQDAVHLQRILGLRLLWTDETSLALGVPTSFIEKCGIYRTVEVVFFLAEIWMKNAVEIQKDQFHSRYSAVFRSKSPDFSICLAASVQSLSASG